MSFIHDTPHPLAGKRVSVEPFDGGGYRVDEIVLEDWWDRLGAGSWMFCDGNPAALKYAIRSGVGAFPFDDEVVYGKARGLGHIVHVSELIEEV